MWLIPVRSALFARAGEDRRFPAFTTTDLNGETVTEAVFAESDITMVKFWTTWCPACVVEKPTLAALYNELGGGMIGILLDADGRGAIENAREILETSGVNYPQLRPSQEMQSLLRTVRSIPTAIFVDSRGYIVGETIVGSRSHEAYLSAISAARGSTREHSEHSEQVEAGPDTVYEKDEN